jgi:hypothetical protein
VKHAGMAKGHGFSRAAANREEESLAFRP